MKMKLNALCENSNAMLCSALKCISFMTPFVNVWYVAARLIELVLILQILTKSRLQGQYIIELKEFENKYIFFLFFTFLKFYIYFTGSAGRKS